jgi:hypothetical protein
MRSPILKRLSRKELLAFTIEAAKHFSAEKFPAMPTENISTLARPEHKMSWFNV